MTTYVCLPMVTILSYILSKFQVYEGTTVTMVHRRPQELAHFIT